MANQRYFLKCPICGEERFMGKSMGTGVYVMGTTLEEIHDWMWKHMENCHEDEFREGILFTVVSDTTTEACMINRRKLNKEKTEIT